MHLLKGLQNLPDFLFPFCFGISMPCYLKSYVREPTYLNIKTLFSIYVESYVSTLNSSF